MIAGQQRDRSAHSKSAWRQSGWAALVSAVALVILACGGGPTTPPSAVATDTATTSSSASPTGTTGGTGSPTATATTGVHTPTATPRPTLQGQILTKALGSSIGPNTNSQIVDVTCPSGYLVAGGGISSGYTTFTIMWDAPISTTTWRAEIFNTSGSTIYAQAQVSCLKVSGLHSQIVTRGLGAINAGTNSSIVDISCPSGYLVGGGGINTGYAGAVMMWNAPISATTLQAEVWNTGGSTIYAQYQVVCLAASGLTSHIVTQSVGNVTPGNNSTIYDIACPSGYLVAGGGINIGYSTFTMMQSEPISTTKWRVEIFNTGGSDITGQFQVACLKY
jgi:hypothetical protein